MLPNSKGCYPRVGSLSRTGDRNSEPLPLPSPRSEDEGGSIKRAKVSSRRGASPRPLTPPYVRFRIRRFMTLVGIDALSSRVRVPGGSKSAFGNASFMCEAPAFHQGPRPFVADARPGLLSPRFISFRRRVAGVSTAARERSAASSVAIRPALRRRSSPPTDGSTRTIPAARVQLPRSASGCSAPSLRKMSRRLSFNRFTDRAPPSSSGFFPSDRVAQELAVPGPVHGALRPG